MAETGLATRSIFVLGVQVNEKPVMSEASNMESLPIRQGLERRADMEEETLPRAESVSRGVFSAPENQESISQH